MKRPTRDEIDAAMSPVGGWTRAQLAEWGVPWPPPKGWRQQLLDEEHSESDWQHIGAAVIDAGAAMVHAISLVDECESPIEIMLGAQLNALFDQRFAGLVEVIPQFKLDRFRYDFAIRVTRDQKPCILIECDGKAFHSTPEQLENDQKKDQAAATAGMQLLRFTGSEINKDPRRCAYVVLSRLALVACR